METIRYEVKIDTALAEVWARQNAARGKLASAKLALAHTVGIRPVYVTRTRREVRETIEELLEIAERMLETAIGYKVREIKDDISDVHAAQHDLYVARQQAAPLEAQFDAAPWNRFFLVNNAGGHIHSSMHCPTCRPTTQFGWLPDLSALTERDAVAAHGTILCSHCYPSAPVAWTLGHAKEVDPNECTGSGTYDVTEGTFRRSGFSGNGYGKCTHCKQNVGVTSTGKLRKHKKEVK